MKTYKYKVRDELGKSISGVMNAESQESVASKLKQMGYLPISVKEEKALLKINRIFAGLKRVKLSEINLFTRQFAVLQKAGVSIIASLNTLRDETTNIKFKNIIGEIIRDIEGGGSLSSALEKHPKVFTPLYNNMVKTGEAAGSLDSALVRLAELGEYEEKVRLRIKAATRYPVMVVTAIIIGFLVLITLVIPRFARVYSQFNVQLPLATRVLLWINFSVTKYWWVLIFMVFILSVGFRRFINTKRGRVWWDNLKLSMPVFGPLVLKMVMSRFARITGALLHSGVPLFEILKLTSEGVGNVIISNAIEHIKLSVSEGKGLSEPMKISGLFPSIVVQMVTVGEETGKLDEMLLYVSQYYDSQVEFTVSNFTAVIEPILIFILGCVVLFMALGIFLPMWNLINLFR